MPEPHTTLSTPEHAARVFAHIETLSALPKPIVPRLVQAMAMDWLRVIALAMVDAGAERRKAATAWAADILERASSDEETLSEEITCRDGRHLTKILRSEFTLYQSMIPDLQKRGAGRSSTQTNALMAAIESDLPHSEGLDRHRQLLDLVTCAITDGHPGLKAESNDDTRSRIATIGFESAVSTAESVRLQCETLEAREAALPSERTSKETVEEFIARRHQDRIFEAANAGDNGVDVEVAASTALEVTIAMLTRLRNRGEIDNGDIEDWLAAIDKELACVVPSDKAPAPMEKPAGSEHTTTPTFREDDPWGVNALVSGIHADLRACETNDDHLSGFDVANSALCGILTFIVGCQIQDRKTLIEDIRSRVREMLDAGPSFH